MRVITDPLDQDLQHWNYMNKIMASLLVSYVRLPSTSRPDRDSFVNRNKMYWKGVESSRIHLIFFTIRNLNPDIGHNFCVKLSVRLYLH